MILEIPRFRPDRSRGRRAGIYLFAVWTAIAPAGFKAQTFFTHDPSGYLRTVDTPLNSAPAITGHPRGMVAPVSGNAGFSVGARGSPPLTYQWQLNSNNIPGPNGDSLLLLNVTPADFGAYRVIVSNPLGSVTSSNAWLQLDADRDGIADSWETNYFTSLTNRSGFQDYDQDGVSDLDEFLEGTQPRFFSSANPRLTIISDHGEVFVTPNVPLLTNGQTVTLTGIPNPGLQFISYIGAASSGPYYSMRTNPAPVKMNGPQTVRQWMAHRSGRVVRSNKHHPRRG